MSKYIFLFFFLLLFTSCHFQKKENKSDGQSVSTSQDNRLSELTDSIQKFPDSAKYLYERGSILFSTEHYDDAKKDFQKAVNLAPLQSEYYTALGQLFAEEQVTDSAIFNFKKALRIDQKNRLARLQLALVYWQNDQYTETLAQTDTLLSQDAKLVKAMGLQSQVYEATGDTAKAILIMKKAIGIPPVSYDALMRMGDLLLDRDKKEALKYYKEASQKNPTAAEPYYCMGLVYEKNGDITNAIDSYNHSITRDPQFEDTYLALGKLYKKKRDWEKAKKIFTLATRMDPTNADAYYERGTVNEKLKDKQAAIADYQQSLIFNDKNAQAAVALKRIKNTP